MNRREILASIGVAAVGALLPTVAFARSTAIEWAPGTLDNPHAALVGTWINERIEEGVLYTRGSNVIDNQIVKLVMPHFRVVPGKPVWSWMTGPTDEPGLAIFITEMGVPITETSILTSNGYEAYFGKPKPEHMPDYAVKQPFLNYDQTKLIEPYLPKGHIDYDMRWIESLKEAR
jgi:hypothetical protein